MISDEVKRMRKVRGLSAQQLADRCAELGMPIPRSVIANLESKRRPTVSVAELIILSRALEVPPVSLLFPVGIRRSVEILPKISAAPLDAASYFSGGAIPEGVSWDEYLDHPLYYFRQHEDIIGKILRAIKRLEMAREARAATLLREPSQEDKRAAERVRQLEAELADTADSGTTVVQAMRDMEIFGELAVLRPIYHKVQEWEGQVSHSEWATSSAKENLDGVCDSLMRVRRRIQALGIDLPDLPAAVQDAISQMEPIAVVPVTSLERLKEIQE
ncbi:helix-turn-helix transcriptional regulator [Kitasatospora sp. NPDC005751]|uniref:helix-turn-helix domain-containing protein n=1 Tax=Kitasatospora sp. NPDC005751 TaxID=3157064 RepID=UPI0033D64C79